jgi:hypothetical protein
MKFNGEIQGLFKKYKLQLHSVQVGQQHSDVQYDVHDIL